ncbi:4-hydroxy-3-methylbut-2-enyl diphosphate reductase [Lachnotalea glycerini]|uniref:4-hydroxy-3-methylbut-2-enyl diphosphate reductase n=1 Tax=Lachnotalea glycerini TaxID=1763509 RepID=A0A255IPD1_9FIRM|nr:4-hydroxy-3-methylbut-2-enyl diphosphate reductase [Lachnotalea glycerini]PXV85653.1 4-hydroxy-3-methylbut-2-enyl diphosphate reductase [Lachnotalea glycerini]RDY31331.1 4-hydroxy-3-methylbut-2-enyl diphosphate reductase [Lachnotalea glycerini]
MKVILAKTAGFCFGVKRAVETVYKQVGKGNIYTFGPIIHNEEVVKDLENKGVKVINSEQELLTISEGTVIIRSHGATKQIYDILEQKGVNYVDATCPFVKKIHKIVSEYSKNGYEIVIIGNDSHPEVEGIKGWCNSKVTVIENTKEALEYTNRNNQKVCIVSQTTFNYNKFKDLVEIISKKGYDIIVLNTICSATEERQTEARRVASQVEAMIVIGDKHSSNTQKLFEICNDECENTYYIQTLDDLDTQSLQFFGSVGITAGASTPNNIIEEVHSNVRNEF